MQTKKLNTARIVRWGVLGASAAFFLFFSMVISEHAICPIGGFETFFNGLFGTGFSLAGLFSGMVLIFLVMSVLSIVFRRAYCGYICPMGTLQELASIIGRKILPRKVQATRVPRKADKILRWVKYAVLASYVIGAAIVGGHWMLPGDPFIVLMNLFARGGLAASWSRFPFAVLFFAAIIAFAFFFGRGFCKYICPAGAWYAILSKVSPLRVVRDESACVGCGACSRACPMNIEVAKAKSVTSAECLGCRECVSSCPAKGALSFRASGANVPPALLPVAAAAVFAGSVALSVATMPARGQRPQGAPGGQGGEGLMQKGSGGDRTQGADSVSGASVQGASMRDAKSSAADTAAKLKVSFGGCANCAGCGICQSV